MKVIVDNYTRILLTVIAVLLVFVGIGLWYEAPSSTPTAYGRIPDQGEQLNDVIDQLKEVNTSIENISKLLVSGKVKVQIVEAPIKGSKVIPVKTKK